MRDFGRERKPVPENGETPLNPPLLLEKSVPLGREFGALLVLILAGNGRHMYWYSIQPH